MSCGAKYKVLVKVIVIFMFFLQACSTFWYVWQKEDGVFEEKYRTRFKINVTFIFVLTTYFVPTFPINNKNYQLRWK